MTPEEARSIIDQGEGQRCEFKETFSSQNEAIESLVAFSNADGGTVFFGVKDDGTEIGVTIGQKTLEDFANRLKANTDPALTPSIDQMVIKQKEVISVTVPKRGQGELYLGFGRPQIRVGRTNQVMSVAQIRHFLLDDDTPLAPELDGMIRGTNVFLRIHHADSHPHQFRVVFHGVSGMVGTPRVRDSWLPWNCGDFQLVGPKQSGTIQVAQADGEIRDIGKVIRFIHDKGRQYDGRLSEYVAFGGQLYLDLELQSDAELSIQSRRMWALAIDDAGTPISFTIQ